MICMGVKIEFDMRTIKGLEQAARESALSVMEKVNADLVNSETMPFHIGDMQNNQTFVSVEGEDTVNGEDVYSVSLVTGSPQARRLYYHPEYNFYQGENDNAGAEWLEPYIDGDKKDFVPETFAKIYKKKTGV